MSILEGSYTIAKLMCDFYTKILFQRIFGMMLFIKPSASLLLDPWEFRVTASKECQVKVILVSLNLLETEACFCKYVSTVWATMTITIKLLCQHTVIQQVKKTQ